MIGTRFLKQLNWKCITGIAGGWIFLGMILFLAVHFPDVMLPIILCVLGVGVFVEVSWIAYTICSDLSNDRRNKW